ncbi:MAG: hypothetical protein AB9903_04285 [Vulcanimicrobiota bacterium]
MSMEEHCTFGRVIDGTIVYSRYRACSGCHQNVPRILSIVAAMAEIALFFKTTGTVKIVV